LGKIVLRRGLIALLALASAAVAAEKSPLALLGSLKLGYIAFCRPSIVDELQIIGEPRELSPADVKRLAAVLGSEDTWYERQPDGTLKGMRTFCIAHWDFKFLIETTSGDVLSIRLCTSCRQVHVLRGLEELSVPNIRPPAMERLGKLLDEWFPDWPAITSKNKQEWDRMMRKRSEER
jgi:hypothetical protein